MAPWRNLEKRICSTRQKKGSVAQLYSASDFGSEGWGLESLRGHKRNPARKCWVFHFRMRSKVLLISKGKGKALQLQSSLGSMLGMPNAFGIMRSIIPNKTLQLQSSLGSMLGMPNACGIMRSIIPHKALQLQSSLGSMLGMLNAFGIMPSRIPQKKAAIAKHLCAMLGQK